MALRRRDALAFGAALPFVGAGSVRAQAPATLQFWEGHSAQEEAATIRMIAAFEAANPDVKINRTKVAFGGDFERITMASASNTLPDVSPIWSGFLAQFAGAGSLLDLGRFGAPDLKGTFAPGCWEYGQLKGNTYGLPYAFDPRFLAYGRTVLAEAGQGEAPGTLDGLREMARRLTVRSGGDVRRYGLAVAANDESMYFFVNLLMAFGGALFGEDGRTAAFNSHAGQDAASFLSALVKDGTVAFNVQTDAMRQGLFNGRFAAVYDGPWVFYEQQRSGQEGFQVGTAPMPGPAPGRRVTIASVGDYVIYASSKVPQQAYRFVSFMASPAAQQYRVGLLKTAVTPAVIDQPVARETFAKWPGLETAQGYLADARILPSSERWGRMSQALLPGIQAIMNGDEPKAAIEAAARQADRNLRR